MSLVYITNASMHLIVRSLLTQNVILTRNVIMSNIANDFMEDGFLEEDLNFFFNTNELKSFYYRKIILQDFANMLKIIDMNINNIAMKIKGENKKYAYDIKAPSYHLDKLCKWKDSSFNNIEIPEECLSDTTNKQVVKQWLKNYRHLEFDILNSKFIEEFNCEKGLTRVSLKNSGTTDFWNFNVNLTIELIEKNTQLRFLLNDELGKKIANYRYAPKYKIDNIVKYEKDKKLHQPIMEYHQAKEELTQIIYSFYQYKYNVDLSFDKSILDAIGFRQCNGCK